MNKIKAKSKRIFFISYYIVLCSLATQSVHLISASQEAIRFQKPLQHEVTVTLKLIQVVVTDKQGNPVTDLRKDEFVLYDNGEQKTLTEFEKHVQSPSSAEMAGEKRIAQTPLAFAPRLLNRKLFFLFDFAYTDPQGLRLAREAALHFVDSSLMPTDEVGVISFSGKRDLQIHEFQTTDHWKVRKAIESFSLQKLLGVLIDPKVVYQQEQVASGGGIIVVASPGSGARFVARNFIWGLTALAQALRYIPGQKQIILFSSGIPASLINRGPPGAMNSDLGYAYAQLCKELATSNVAIYPINTDPPTVISESVTLHELASATGGQYLGRAVNSAEHLEKIQTLTRTYYVLGYPIGKTWDGKYHKIKVKVSRPGCEVRAQAGYLNPKPFAEYTDLEKQIHLVDLALSETPLSQTPIRFSMAALSCSLEKKNNLFLAAEIPVQKLRDVAGKKAEIISLVFDAKDDIISLRGSEEDFSSLSHEGAYLLSMASAPPGVFKCRIVVRNLETGAAAVAASTATVPDPKKKGIQIFPPLILRPEKDGLYLKGHMPKASSGRIPAASVDSLLFDPAQYVPVVEKTLRSNSEAWASVRCAFVGEPAWKIKLSAFLYDKTTREQIHIPMTILNQKEESGIKTFLVHFQIPNIEPDEYLFLLIAENTTSGSTSQVVSDFIIQ